MIRLTAEDVVNIRHARHDGDTVIILADKYQVSRSTIEKIVRGLRRPDLPGPVRPRQPGWPRKMPSSTKLTDYQVVLIRLKAAAGTPRPALATEYGVSLPCITDIVNGRTRTDLPGPRTKRPTKTRSYTPRPRLTSAQVVTIRERYANNDGTQDSLAAEYDVWPVTIGRIVRGETHQELGGPITHRYKKRAT